MTYNTKSKISYLVSIFVILLIALASFSILAVPVQAQSLSYISINLSGTLNANDSPYGIDCSDTDNVYMTIDAQGLLARVSKADKTATILPDNNVVSGGENFYGIATDSSKRVFTNARDWGMLWRFDPSTSTWSSAPMIEEITGNPDVTYPSGYATKPNLLRVDENPGSHGIHTQEFSANSFGGVVFANGNIWVALDYLFNFDTQAEANAGVTDLEFHGLVKVNPSTLAVTRIPIAGAGALRGMLVDGNTVWVTDYLNDKIFKFDTTSETVTAAFTLGAGSKPNELDQSGSFLYVALRKAAGGNLEIAKVDKTLGTTTIIDLGVANTNGGTFAIFVSGDILGWSSDSAKIGTYNILTGAKQSFVTTTSANRFMCVVGGEFWIAGKGSASVVVMAIPEESTTTTSTGGGGTYNPQVIPAITLNSTGLAGQHNIYITRNGSVTLTGFLWFQNGGSSGTFECLITDLNGLCVAPPSLGPSRGNFQSLTWTSPPTVEGPQPACSLVPYLWFCKTVASPVNQIQTSPSKFGIFCNNAYIVKQCDGNGIPINYQTFKITVSNLPFGQTVITLQAIGTASDGQISIQNVIIYNM